MHIINTKSSQPVSMGPKNFYKSLNIMTLLKEQWFGFTSFSQLLSNTKAEKERNLSTYRTTYLCGYIGFPVDFPWTKKKLDRPW